MRIAPLLPFALAAGLGLSTAQSAVAQNVKVTPLGSHSGEFCPLDCALVFEDPDGARILYDAGRTLRGPQDTRRGKMDAVLLSHVHGDHLGDRIQPSDNAGTCAKPDFSAVVAPGSNTFNIAVGKKSKPIVGGEMAKYFSLKVKEAGGDPAQVQLVRFGATSKIGGVTIASVPAVHSNGLSAYMGPPGGFVLTFNNGLVVYLSGDTGVTAEQDVVVRRMYKAGLVVLSIGGTFTTGPVEAAYIINELVKPQAVIASHANELATEGGKLRAGTKTETFIKATTVPVHLPLSGRTMEFAATGVCAAGC